MGLDLWVDFIFTFKFFITKLYQLQNKIKIDKIYNIRRKKVLTSFIYLKYSIKAKLVVRIPEARVGSQRLGRRTEWGQHQELCLLAGVLNWESGGMWHRWLLRKWLFTRASLESYKCNPRIINSSLKTYHLWIYWNFIML